MQAGIDRKLIGGATFCIFVVRGAGETSGEPGPHHDDDPVHGPAVDQRGEIAPRVDAAQAAPREPGRRAAQPPEALRDLMRLGPA
jgi:hypothetical protein